MAIAPAAEDAEDAALDTDALAAPAALVALLAAAEAPLEAAAALLAAAEVADEIADETDSAALDAALEADKTAPVAVALLEPCGTGVTRDVEAAVSELAAADVVEEEPAAQVADWGRSFTPEEAQRALANWIVSIHS